MIPPTIPEPRILPASSYGLISLNLRPSKTNRVENAENLFRVSFHGRMMAAARKKASAIQAAGQFRIKPEQGFNPPGLWQGCGRGGKGGSALTIAMKEKFSALVGKH